VSILDEAAERIKELYGEALDRLTVERAVVGVFFSGVMFSDGCAGVAYTPPELISRASTKILGGGFRTYRGRPAAEMISNTLDGHFAHVIRLAALNALSAPLFAQKRFGECREGDFSEMPELIRGRRVCMVGAIIPLLKKFGAMGASEIAIIDKKKETQAEAKLGRFVELEKTAETLGACETAVITGAAIANGSMEELLSYLPKGAAVAVVGPTAGFAPTPLFRRGVTAVGTSAICDGEQALEVIAQGGGGLTLFKDCAHKINLINTPALDAVLQGRPKQA
jgi:uncharacterized protein (DUF4213/DUF364 family)